MDAKLQQVLSLKRDDKVRVYYDLCCKKSAVYSVVSVSPEKVLLSSASAVYVYEPARLASRLVEVVS